MLDPTPLLAWVEVAALAAAPVATPVAVAAGHAPPPELLEFLGEWGRDDGEVTDPSALAGSEVPANDAAPAVQDGAAAPPVHAAPAPGSALPAPSSRTPPTAPPTTPPSSPISARLPTESDHVADAPRRV